MAKIISTGLLVAVLLGSGMSRADQGPIEMQGPEPDLLFSEALIIESEELGIYRGGTEVVVNNDSTLGGMVHDNQAYNLTTGSNLVAEGSLSGASGFATVIQNSGNNVLIQNSTIVNVQVK